MSSVNARLAYLSGVALVLIVCVIVVLGESKKTGSECKPAQCDTTQCDSTKCDQRGTKCDTIY